MWKGEREIQPKSPLLFPDWNCYQSLATNWNTFSFQFIIMFVGWNLIFKGANCLVSVTYLVPLYQFGAPKLIYSHIHVNPVVLYQQSVVQPCLTVPSGTGRLWRESCIVGLWLLGSSVEVKPLREEHHVSIRQGKGWRDSTPVSSRWSF